MTNPLGVVQGTLELLVLRTLGTGAGSTGSAGTESSMHGFEILDSIRDATDDALVVEDGALYPALRRMEKRGWLESTWGVSGKGRRARYYTLTSLGRTALAEEQDRWERYVAAVAKLGTQGA